MELQDSTATWNVLELFSGIGGMHRALSMSGRSFRVQAACDINEAANTVYAKNYPSTRLRRGNVQSITIKDLQAMEIDSILMSPPCQPFTRQGLMKDVEDPRTDGFLAVCYNIIEQHEGLQRILMENVKGFETSQARNQYVEVLQRAGFFYQEYLLNPRDCLGIPNSRLRYFCIARKGRPFTHREGDSEDIRTEIYPEPPPLQPVKEFIESGYHEECLIPDKDLLQNAWVFDIVTPESESTCCFTKAYGHFARGTGSVFCPLGESKVKEVFDRLRDNSDLAEGEQLAILKELQLRYFTPREIEKLMGFEEPLIYTDLMSSRLKYKLLGNSLNVKVVAELIKLLDKDNE